MKTLISKLGLGIVLSSVLSLIPLNYQAQNQQNQTSDYSITIDSKTTPQNIEDIKKMLDDHQITAKFSNIERNSSGDLTGIKIELTDENGNQTVSRISSNYPIHKLSFGKKDGSLFISQDGLGFRDLALIDPSIFSQDQDSIFGQPFNSFNQFNFDDFFSNEDQAFFLNGESFSFEDLKQQLEEQMKQMEKQGDMFSQYLYEDNSQKFHFIDDPDTEKLIIIDGKESDFETLNDLAENDKIKSVDHLKPDTATSIYGKKAKDGAIIVTTKK